MYKIEGKLEKHEKGEENTKSKEQFVSCQVHH